MIGWMHTTPMDTTPMLTAPNTTPMDATPNVAPMDMDIVRVAGVDGHRSMGIRVVATGIRRHPLGTGTREASSTSPTILQRLAHE